jgi:hypothetical protein
VVKVPILANASSEQGVAAFDKRSVAHFGIGTAAGLLGVNPVLVILAALGYKAGMEMYRSGERGLTRRQQGESCLNQITDVLLTVAGVYAGGTVRRAQAASAQIVPTGALGCAGGCQCGRH